MVLLFKINNCISNNFYEAKYDELLVIARKHLNYLLIKRIDEIVEERINQPKK